MGRLGSDQTGSARKKIERWGKEDVKAEETGPSDSAVLSIRKISERNGKYAHVVECRLAATPLKRSLFTLQKRVFSESQDDPDGRASALRFTFTTDTLPAFRSFLFGKSEYSHCESPVSADASSSAKTEGSCAGTGIIGSLSARVTSYVCVRQNTLHDLWFTTAVCRLSEGSLRSISFRNLDKHLEAEVGKVATFLRSAASKSWVYRVVNQALACGGEAGHCRQNGEVSVKCKRCGGLEHPECHGQTALADKQASEDYICSTCLMAEREEVLSIRMEEQGEGATNLEELRSEARSVYMESDWRACCVCGCEDNEDLDDLIPCLCDSSVAVVHPSCAAACKASALPSALARHTSVQCLICGGQGVLHNGGSNKDKEGGNKAAVKRQGGNTAGMKRSLKSIQVSGKGVKRSRTTATNGTVKVEDSPEHGSGPMWNSDRKESTMQVAQIESRDTDSEKSGVGLLGRRFSDAPAIVPIKKRRIQMPEVIRSPSPPPRSPSPGSRSPPPILPSPKCPSLPPRSPSPVSPSLPQRSPSLGSPTTLPTSPSPGSLSPSPRSPLPPRSVSLELELSTGVDEAATFPVLSAHVEETLDKKEEGMVVQSSSPPPELSCRVQSSPSPSELGFLEHSSSPPPELGCPVHSSSPPSELGCLGHSSSPPSELGCLGHSASPPPELGCLVHSVSPPPRLPSPSSYQSDENHKAEDEEDVITSVKEGLGVEDKNVVDESLEESMGEASGHSPGDSMDEDPVPEKLQGALLRSNPGCIRDDRLRWDLNMEMEAWEKVTDQAAGTHGEVSRIEDHPPTSTCADSDGSGHDKSMDDSVGGLVIAQGEEEPGAEENDDYCNPDCRDVDDHGVEADEMTLTVQGENDLKAEAAPVNLEFDNPASWEGETASDGGEGEANEKFGMQEEHQEDDAQDSQMLDSKLEKQGPSRSKAAGWNQLPEELEAEEHVDYGDSDCRDADDMGLEVDERTSMALQDEGDWKAEEATGNFEADNPVPWEGEAVSDAGETQEKSGIQEEGPKPSVCDSQPPEPSWEKHTRSERTKTTGWDQLPEGFDSAEEALKAVKEKSSRGGRGGPWSTSGGRGSLLSSQGTFVGSRLGTGRGASRADGFLGERPRSDELLRDRDSFSHGRRLDDGLDVNLKFASRDIGRGRSFGRGGPAAGIHGRGRAGGWVDPQGGSLGQWGPGRRRSTVGFGLQGPTNAAAVAAAKVESSGFVVAPDGTITKAGSGVAPGRGIRSTIGANRDVHGPHVNIGRGPPMEMEGGMNFPLRIGVGTGRGMGTSSTAGRNAGGRGLLSGIGPGLVGGIAERGRSAGRGMMDRYREHSFSSGGMDTRRSESPRRSMHPLDLPNSNNRMPLSFRPESRVERSKTPPSSHHSLVHSKFVPSESARIQRSPPPSSKWSSDKREPDAFRERDFKRPLSRPRMPPRRTSPHVVHGSSLMDERDRQVLAGARHSPPARVALSSSVSSAGKSGDGSSETRRPKRDEDEDIRITASRSKEMDYARISPRENDKDRDNRGSVLRRDRNKDDDRKRDSIKLSGKDGRSISGHKHASIRDGDDDVAPRRRRPS